MTIEKSTPEELIVQFKERYQTLVNTNQELSQKIKENETVALKLLGAIEALEYVTKEDQEVDIEDSSVSQLD